PLFHIHIIRFLISVMARVPQPREVAELKGATRHNPQRYRTEPAKSSLPLGAAPEGFAGAELRAWVELETYAAAGVLTAAERPLLELTCRLMAEMRTNFAQMPSARITALISCLARLGLTPADRQKVGMPKGEKERDPFADFN